MWKPAGWRWTSQAAESQVAATRRELNRLQAIGDIVAKKDLQKAESDYQAAQAQLQSLQNSANKATVSSNNRSLTLKAPISGTVSAFNLAVGAEVTAGQTLFNLVNLNKVYVEAQLYDTDAAQLTNSGRYTVICANDDHKTEAVRLLSVAQEMNVTNQSQKVLFELDNANKEFKIGEFVNVIVANSNSERKLSVPNRAISEINGRPVVFVKSAPEQYTFSYVALGNNNGSQTVVEKGLEGGSRVVTEGVYQMKMMYLNQ